MAEARGPTPMIAAEIRSLRKGRGVQAIGLDQRLGPHLRELAAGADERDIAILRHSLASELLARAAALPEDLRTAIMASLGLSDATRHMPYFSDRVSWLAGHLDRDARTAQRRIEEAEHLLAEEIARELQRRRGWTPADGWYLDELRTILRLDTPTPESHERRRIVCTKAGLREVTASLDIPRDLEQGRPALTGEVLYGGQLVRREQPALNRFHFVVQLPAALRWGDKHEFELILRLAPGEPMRPHYIFTPECQCNLFDLRVRFGADQHPQWLRRVNGETVRTFDQARPVGELLSLDEAGEAHQEFRNLTRYLGYGIQWLP